MLSQDFVFIVLAGCIGGLLPDILRIIKNRYKKKPPSYLKSRNFWLGVFLLVALGGLAASLLAQSPKDALAYGFAAPEIFSRLASKSAEGVDLGDAGFFDLRAWWAG